MPDAPDTEAVGELPAWGEVAGMFRAQFPALDEDLMRSRYEQAQTLDRVRSQMLPISGIDTAVTVMARRSLPYVSSIASKADDTAYDRAQRRLDDGHPEPDDYRTIAIYERERQAEGHVGPALDLAARIPALAGEAFTGGAALRGLGLAGQAATGGLAARTAAAVTSPAAWARNAATTAAAPSFWAEQWTQNNLQNQRDPLDVRGLPPAFVLGMLNTAILGSVGNAGNAITGAGVRPVAERLLARTLAGVGGQEAAHVLASGVSELLPEAYKLETGYGSLGSMLRGRHGEGWQNLAAETLAAAVFAGIHEVVQGAPPERPGGMTPAGPGPQPEVPQGQPPPSGGPEPQPGPSGRQPPPAPGATGAPPEMPGGGRWGEPPPRQPLRRGQSGPDVMASFRAAMQRLKAAGAPEGEALALLREPIQAIRDDFTPWASRGYDVGSAYEYVANYVVAQRLSGQRQPPPRSQNAQEAPQAAPPTPEAAGPVQEARTPPEQPQGQETAQPMAVAPPGGQEVAAPAAEVAQVPAQPVAAPPPAAATESAPVPEQQAQPQELTARERHVIQERGKGRSFRAIARDREMGGVSYEQARLDEQSARAKLGQEGSVEQAEHAPERAGRAARLQEMGQQAEAPAPAEGDAEAVRRARAPLTPEERRAAELERKANEFLAGGGTEEQAHEVAYHIAGRLEKAQRQGQDLNRFLKAEFPELAGGEITDLVNGFKEYQRAKPHLSAEERTALESGLVVRTQRPRQDGEGAQPGPPAAPVEGGVPAPGIAPAPAPEAAPAAQPGAPAGATGPAAGAGNAVNPEASFFAQRAEQPNLFTPREGQPIVGHMPEAPTRFAEPTGEKTPIPSELVEQMALMHKAGDGYTLKHWNDVLVNHFGFDKEIVKAASAEARSAAGDDAKTLQKHPLHLSTGLRGIHAQSEAGALKAQAINFILEALAPKEVADVRQQAKAQGLSDERTAEILRSAGDEAQDQAAEAGHAGDVGSFDPSEFESRPEPPRREPRIVRGARRQRRSGELNVEAFRPAVDYVADAVRRYAGQMFPSTTRLDRSSGEALSRMAVSRTYSAEAAGYYTDLILGDAASDPEARKIAGAYLTERRLRYMRLKRGMKDVTTIIGKDGSPFKTEADYQAARKSPFIDRVERAWNREFVPFMEETYRRAFGMEDTDPIISDTQIPGSPVSLKSLMVGDDVPESTVFTSSAGRLNNPRARKLKFSRQATGQAEAYDVDLGNMIEHRIMGSVPLAAQAEAYRVLEKAGLLKWGHEGQRLPFGDRAGLELPNVRPPKGTQAAIDGQTSAFIHPDAADEVRAALAVDAVEPWMKVMNGIATVPTIGALASFVEAATHGLNLATSAFAPGMLKSVFLKVHQFVRNDPEMQKQLLELARIGATKPHGMESGTIIEQVNRIGELVLGKTLPENAKYLDPSFYGGRFLKGMDRIIRSAAADAYDQLAKSGEVRGTETGKRDFINQLTGQYEKRAQNGLIRMLRNSGLGPFATAASVMTARSIRMSTVGGTGADATSAGASLRMRAQVIGKLGAILAGAFLLNYLRWGRWDGDEATSFGDIKVGETDEGKTVSIATPASLLVRRGWRNIGLLALVEGQRREDSSGKIAARATTDIVHGVMHPAQGPVYQFGHTALTGENGIGMRVAPRPGPANENPYPGNIAAAFGNLNPVIASMWGLDAHQSEDPQWYERVAKLLGPLGPRYKASAGRGAFRY